MGRKIARKEIPLSIFYLKHFLYLFLAIIAICLVSCILFFRMVNSDKIYPANYAERQANAAQATIEETDFVTEDLIPDLCRYAVFDMDGNFIRGNISGQTRKYAWEAAAGKPLYKFGSYYKVIQREKEYCVLQYKIIPQYKSETLRKYVCPPQKLIFLGTLMMVLLSMGICAVRSGYVLKKKMHPLIQIAEKIQNQDLDFSVSKGDIKEINSILEAMGKMSNALRLSLEHQWEAEQRRKEQISALAHDLKTPLTIIRGNAEILSDTSPTEEQAESIQFIEESALQMQGYIKTLIELASDTNQLSPQYREIPLLDFVQDIHKTAEGLCSSQKISLKWDFRSEYKAFRADAGLLSRAISNVLSNAVENSPENGAVSVDIFDEKGYVVFSISDNGKGFSSRALKYATMQFFMDDTSRNSKFHFGIGLYFTDAVIQLHGGQLILENLEDSFGAKVTMKLPVQ